MVMPFPGARSAAGAGVQGADSFVSLQRVKFAAACAHLLWMGTGKMPRLLPHFTELYNKASEQAAKQ